MAQITLRTANHVVPMIYAYTTPEIARHNGWTKIGYTEQDVEKRLEQQTHTADVNYHLEWKGNAIFDDGSGERFTDHDFMPISASWALRANRAPNGSIPLAPFQEATFMSSAQAAAC